MKLDSDMRLQREGRGKGLSVMGEPCLPLTGVWSKRHAKKHRDDHLYGFYPDFAFMQGDYNRESRRL